MARYDPRFLIVDENGINLRCDGAVTMPDGKVVRAYGMRVTLDEAKQLVELGFASPADPAAEWELRDVLERVAKAAR